MQICIHDFVTTMNTFYLPTYRLVESSETEHNL